MVDLKGGKSGHTGVLKLHLSGGCILGYLEVFWKQLNNRKVQGTKTVAA